MAAITIAGENLIAAKHAAQEVLVVTKFIYALVPGLNPDGPVDRHAPKPPPEQITYQTVITKGGYVNPNQVVYSSMVGSNVGDWDFNWLGLETAEGVLLAVAYMPVQQKRKNIPNRQIGNNITRNILLIFDGAQSITNLSINSNTWQADFTVRLAGIDERERLSNRDLFGRACFFGDSLSLYYQSGEFKIRPGTAYVEGLCVKQGASVIAQPAYPFTMWYDISLRRYVNEMKVMLAVRYGENLVDFVDTDGSLHYLVPVATVASSSSITDLRATVEPVNGPLIQHLAARNGDYPYLRARATTKDDVGLGNLPNEKSDDPTSNSSEILATTAALFTLKEDIDNSLGTAAYRDIGVDPSEVPEYLANGLSGFGYGALTSSFQQIDFDTFVSVNNQTVYAQSSSANGPPGLSAYHGIAEFFHGSSGCLIQRVTFTAAASVGGQIWQRSRYASGQAFGAWKMVFNPLIDTSNPLYAMPIGIPVPWYKTTPPADCLNMAGQTFSASTYPELALAYPGLKLPDLRSAFIRGWANGVGLDAGRVLLTEQADALQNIIGSFQIGVGAGSAYCSTASGAFLPGVSAEQSFTQGTSNLTSLPYSTTFNASRSARTASETRPYNVAFNFICRAK